MKRSNLPLRFRRQEWSRLEAEAKRLGWRWVIAAVSENSEVTILDPHKAKKAREVRISEDARIENLLKWMDSQRRK